MFDSSYPKPVSEVMSTLIEICRYQKRVDLVELLVNAHAHFEAINFDNWNGGTTTWALRLEIPVPAYAGIHQNLSETERELRDKLGYLDRLYENDPIGEVSLTPITSPELALGQRLAPSENELRRIWRPDQLRLFVSHVSAHRVDVAELRDSLHDVGVSAFVAHEDIEPSREWPAEISNAMRSMDALLAMITADFHESEWTDQEVGWALGRGVPIIPVMFGTKPYGFIGKQQGLPGSWADIYRLSEQVVRTLLRTEQVHGRMRGAIVTAFEASDCFPTAQRMKNIILEVDDFTEDESNRIRRACKDNRQISAAPGVAKAITERFGVLRSSDGDIPDDEVPF